MFLTCIGKFEISSRKNIPMSQSRNRYMHVNKDQHVQRKTRGGGSWRTTINCTTPAALHI